MLQECSPVGQIAHKGDEVDVFVVDPVDDFLSPFLAGQRTQVQVRGKRYAISLELRGWPSNLSSAAAPLADLAAPHGILFTTGNHEYYFEADAWLKTLPDFRIRVLDNASHPIERGETRLLMAGITDCTGEEFGDSADLTLALSDRQPGDTMILLAHQPRQIYTAADADVDLQLSGHTQGGQFWPFHLPTQAQQGTLAGWSKHGDTQLWTSRGAGFWGPPIRVGAPPDVSILTLTRG